MDIINRVEKLIYLANILVIEHPGDARIKAMLQSLEEVKTEFSKSELDKNKIDHLTYVVTRVFTDMLDFENTPFGEELGNLLIELNKYIYGS